jgi:hypothetical protein
VEPGTVPGSFHKIPREQPMPDNAADWLEDVPPWRPGMFRLFLSHVSAPRGFAGDLKLLLVRRGIDLFVAHEDIQPTARWLDTITSALKSAHALAALLTDDFRQSEWTDQEVGYALCRGIPIWSLMLNNSPHGFMGQYQALRCDLEQPSALAAELFSGLMGHRESAALLRRGMVARLATSPDFSTSINLAKQLRQMSGFTRQELELLAAAPANNSQVRLPHRVEETIQEILERNDFQQNSIDRMEGLVRPRSRRSVPRLSAFSAISPAVAKRRRCNVKVCAAGKRAYKYPEILSTCLEG